MLAVFFGVQVLGVARARFVHDRFFSWAPLHEVTELRIRVVEHDRALDLPAIRARYAIPRSLVTPDRALLRELNDADPLLERITRIECARAAPADVRVELFRNGVARVWAVRCP